MGAVKSIVLKKSIRDTHGRTVKHTLFRTISVGVGTTAIRWEREIGPNKEMCRFIAREQGGKPMNGKLLRINIWLG